VITPVSPNDKCFLPAKHPTEPKEQNAINPKVTYILFIETKCNTMVKEGERVLRGWHPQESCDIGRIWCV